jgi:hypothetical protein
LAKNRAIRDGDHSLVRHQVSVIAASGTSAQQRVPGNQSSVLAPAGFLAMARSGLYIFVIASSRDVKSATTQIKHVGEKGNSDRPTFFMHRRIRCISKTTMIDLSLCTICMARQ